MNRKELRAIANYHNQKEPLPENTLRVRIGNRDTFTGHYEVILPDGSILKNGMKLFDASVPYGTEVEGKLSPNGQLFYLDYLDAQNIEETPPIDEPLEDEPTEAITLILVIDITRSIETKGITQALAFLKRTEKDENNQDVEVGFLVDFPSSLVGYVAFGDNWTATFPPTNPEDLITELQTQIDNFTGDYSGGGFWGSEGTDLPENGIDAISKAIEILTEAIADKKYIYLVTDNNRYSLNENNPEDVYDAIIESDLTLNIDIVEPVNVVSEHIVIEGEEENPYCSDSANLAVKVNNETVGIYGAGSEVLISESQNKYKFKSIIALFTGLQIKKYIVKVSTSANVFKYYYRFYVVDSPDSVVFNSPVTGNTFISNVYSQRFIATGWFSYDENVLPSDASLSSIRNFFENTERFGNSTTRFTLLMIAGSVLDINDIIEILVNEPVYPIEITQIYNFRDGDFFIPTSSTYNSFTASFNDEVIFEHLMQTLRFALNRSKNDFDDELLIYEIDGNTFNILYDGSLEYSVVFTDWNLIVKVVKRLGEFPQFIKWDNGQHETQSDMFSYGYSVDLNNTNLTLNLTQKIGSNPPQNYIIEWGTINYPISFLYIAYTFEYDESFTTEIRENTNNYFKVFSTEEVIPQLGFLMFYPDDNDGYNVEYLPLRLLDLDTFPNEEMTLTINSITINKNLNVTILDPNNINDVNQFEEHIYPSVKSGEITEFIPVVDNRNIMTPLTFEDLDGLYGKFAYKLINPNGIELVSNAKQLKVNGNNIQTLEEEDEVTVICQPQEIPLVLPDNALYTNALPPSDNIIYL
jgi:hypothetical protein